MTGRIREFSRQDTELNRKLVQLEDNVFSLFEQSARSHQLGLVGTVSKPGVIAQPGQFIRVTEAVELLLAEPRPDSAGIMLGLWVEPGVTSATARVIRGSLDGFGNSMMLLPNHLYLLVHDAKRWCVAGERHGAAGHVDVRDFGRVGTADDSATLRKALTAAGAGGRVLIPAGMTVTVDNITLTSRTIVGPGTLKWKAGSTNPMFTLTGSKPGFECVTFDGESNNHGTTVAIVTVAATQVRFSECTILNFRYKFFLTDINNSPGGQVRGCYVYNCGQVTDCDIFGIRGSRWSFAQTDFEHVTGAGHMIRLGQYNIGDTTPIVDTRITGCSFYDSVEVGIVCELYTQGAEISGNTFRNLGQGVKCENSGSTVSGINIIGNEFRNITISTAFNWTVPGTYNSNRCYDCAGGIELLKDAVCNDNYLENCGNSGEGSIHVSASGTGRFTINGNVIVNPPSWGIVLDADNQTCVGNKIYNVTLSTKSAIYIDGASNVVQGNTIDTLAAGTTGLQILSTCSESSVTGNVLRNVGAGTALSATASAGMRTVICKDNEGAGSLALTYTIAAGVITVGFSAEDCVLNTEGGAATDDLDTITAQAGMRISHVIVLRDNSAANDVTVKHGTGNILLTGAADFVFTTSANNQIGLMWTGSRWRELWRNP